MGCGRLSRVRRARPVSLQRARISAYAISTRTSKSVFEKVCCGRRGGVTSTAVVGRVARCLRVVATPPI
jgi:hypothetical protein